MPRSSSVPSLEQLCRQETSIFLSNFYSSKAVYTLPILPFLTIYGQDIMAKRNQKPEVRKAQREQAVRAAKDQKKTTVKKPAVKVRLSNLWQFSGVPLFFSDVYTLLYPGQGCAEGTKGNEECPEGRARKGWWQEINIL